MKKLISFFVALALAPIAFAASAAFPYDSANTSKQAQDSLKFPSGKAVTFQSGSTLTALAGSTVDFTGATLIGISGGGGSGTWGSITGTLSNQTDLQNALNLKANLSLLSGITFTGVSSPALTVTGTTSISGANTGDQNLFSSIPVSGQTTVTASSPTTALTFVAGSNMTITTNNTSKTVTFAAAGGGGGTPGGSTAQVQFNDSGAFGGDAGLTYDKATDVLTVAGGVVGNASTATALQTARTINGTSFDGTANITVPAAAGTLTGATLASNVTASSLLSAAGGSFGTAAFTNVGAYEVPLTFSTGLTRSTNTVTVNTSQNIATLSNLTSNGFVKTSGGDGTLSVDTATYQPSDAALTALAGGSDFVAFSGPTTSTKTFTLPNASSTLLYEGGAIGGTTPAAGTFTTLVAGNATSLLLGTAGSAVGSAGFRNATSGTATLAPPTGALGTYTVTLPNAASTLPIFGQQITFSGPTAARTVTLPDASFTMARTDAANTFTGASATTSWTLTTPVITSGLTASGSGSNDFSGSTGTFKTSTGATTISNLTSNGFVKTSGGTGALSVDTTTYQTQDAALTALAAGSDFVTFSGPATSTKTFTLPNASSTILTDNAAVTVAQGGTGIASGTSGGIPYFSGSTSIASSAALAANAIVIGGGAGVAPSTTTTGANVLLALASAASGSSGGVLRQTDPIPLTPNAAVSGNVIDVTKRHNTQTLSGDVTWTLSGTPAAGTVFGIDIVDDGTARTVTLPAGTWKSLTRGGTTITTITTSPNVVYEISIRYDGTAYWMIGDPFNISMLTADAAPTSDDIVETYDITTSLPKKSTLALAVQSVLPSPGIIGGGTPSAGVFTTLTAGSATSLLLGTSGTAVGSIGFRNATSGTATLAPPTGALGTYQVTLPNAASTLPIFGQQITFSGPTAARTVTLPDASFTVARTDAANTFTGASTATSWTLTTPAITTSATVTNNLAANTSGDGVILTNTSSATSGNQRYSPRLRLTGAYFETTGSASRVADYIVENVPIEGSTSSRTSKLLFSDQYNAGGYNGQMALAGGILFGATGLWFTATPAGSPSSSNYAIAGSGTSLFLNAPSSTINFAIGGTGYGSITSTGAGFGNTGVSATSWGTAGIQLRTTGGNVYTNSSTAGSGTATSATFVAFGQSTLAATNSSVTTTDAATVYIADGPAAGSNMTITNSWGLWNVGKTRLDGSVTLGAALVDSVGTRTGAGAISLTVGTTKLTTTGANALTLADGVEGQIIRIVMVSDGGDGTLTPTTKTGFTTIVFDDIGDTVELEFIGGGVGWVVISRFGAVVS